MFLERKALGVYGANSYVLADKKTKEAVIIDCGGEPEEIEKIVSENKLEVKNIILTHGHADHIAGVNSLIEKYDVDVLLHEDDEELLTDEDKNLSTVIPGNPVKIERYKLLKDGEKIELGNYKIEVIHTPGHTRGSICLKVDGKLLTGDTLFEGSIGRTDLYGGGDDILDSIAEKIMPIEEDLLMLPGHGGTMKLFDEKRTNPYLLQLKGRL